MSLCRILIVRYSRFAPRTSRDSFFTIVPAPWCGYTTLSPTLYKRSSPSVDAFRQKSRRDGRRPRVDKSSKNRLEKRLFRRLQLQIAVDEVVLLQPAQALADLAGPHGADALPPLEIALRSAHDGVESAEITHHPADHRLGEARDMREDAIAPRLDGMVEWIDSARIAEELAQAFEIEQVLVAERPQRLERDRRLRPGSDRVVVAHDRVSFGRDDVSHELFELEPDQAAFAPELDAVARDALGHPRGHLGPLECDEHVVQHDGVLELERRQPGQHLLEPLAVGVERADRLVRLREHVRDRVELVARLPDEDRDGLPLLRDRDDE